jgi:hypothetical protein
MSLGYTKESSMAKSPIQLLVSVRRSCVSVACLCCLTSCLYFHDEALHSTAAKAQSQFQELVEDSPARGHANSHAALGELAEEVARELYVEDEQIRRYALARTKWSDLVEQTKKLLSSQRSSLATTQSLRTNAEKRVKDTLENLPGVQKERANHLEALKSMGETNSGSDHPNPTQPQSHPAVTPSTDLLPSQPQGHFARNPTP